MKTVTSVYTGCAKKSRPTLKDYNFVILAQREKKNTIIMVITPERVLTCYTYSTMSKQVYDVINYILYQTFHVNDRRQANTVGMCCKLWKFLRKWKESRPMLNDLNRKIDKIAPYIMLFYFFHVWTDTSEPICLSVCVLLVRRLSDVDKTLTNPQRRNDKAN